MSKLELRHMKLLREAKSYLKDVQPLSDISYKKDGIVLTQEHIAEWLEVFYDDRIMLDGCNQAKIKY